MEPHAMPYDENGNELLSAAALIDQDDYLRRIAKDLTAGEVPKRTPSPDSVSRSDLERTLASLCEHLGAAVRELVVRPLIARIQELEAREWCGTWQANKSYARGAIVSYDGSAWVALRQYPDSKPGAGANSGWRLIVKRGRDAR